jgi:hypothetical protein
MSWVPDIWGWSHDIKWAFTTKYFAVAVFLLLAMWFGVAAIFGLQTPLSPKAIGDLHGERQARLTHISHTLAEMARKVDDHKFDDPNSDHTGDDYVKAVKKDLESTNIVRYAINFGLHSGVGGEWLSDPVARQGNTVETPAFEKLQCAETVQLKKDATFEDTFEQVFFLNNIGGCKRVDPATGKSAWELIVSKDGEAPFVVAYVPVSLVGVTSSNMFLRRQFNIGFVVFGGFLVFMMFVAMKARPISNERSLGVSGVLRRVSWSDTKRGVSSPGIPWRKMGSRIPLGSRWWISIAFTIAAAFGAGILIWFATQDPANDEFHPDSPDSLRTTVLRHIVSGGQAADRVRTGIHIDALSFGQSNEIEVSGVVWQVRDVAAVGTTDEETPLPGVRFGNSLRGQLLSSGGAISDDTGVDGNRFVREFSKTFPVEFESSAFPFDHEMISIRLEPESPEGSVVLVPDFESYQIAYPESSPGLGDGVSVPGFKIAETFFSYQERSYGPRGDALSSEGDFPLDLYYNIRIERSFVAPLFSKLIPIFVVLCMLFAILVVVDDAMAGDKKETVSLMTYCAALLFVAILLHVSIRDQLFTSSVTFVDQLFILTYVVIVFVVGVVIRLMVLSARHDRKKRKGRKRRAPTSSPFWRFIFWPVVALSVFAFAFAMSPGGQLPSEALPKTDSKTMAPEPEDVVAVPEPPA